MKAQDPTEAQDTAYQLDYQLDYWLNLHRDQLEAREFFSHQAPDGCERHFVAAYCAISSAIRKTEKVIARHGGLLLIGAPTTTEESSAVEASLIGGAA